MLEEIFEEVKEAMARARDALRRDLASIRTGRASATLLDGIRVDYYGTPTPLNQLATVSVPEARLLVIKPYEQGLIADIEKAVVSDANLGLNPSNDGSIIRLPIPELTEDRRRELTKIARHRSEDAKISVRQARRDGLDFVDEAKKDGDISEDDARHAHDHIQKTTDEFIAKIDDVNTHKEKEIMEV